MSGWFLTWCRCHNTQRPVHSLHLYTYTIPSLSGPLVPTSTTKGSMQYTLTVTSLQQVGCMIGWIGCFYNKTVFQNGNVLQQTWPHRVFLLCQKVVPERMHINVGFPQMFRILLLWSGVNSTFGANLV